MKKYKVLNKNIFSKDKSKIIPIRYQDRFDIMNWRNEQIYHLRQNKILTTKDQDDYFNNIVKNLYNQDEPNQILFSFLQNDVCIGYGGLVHINWIDKNAEISFVMDTKLENKSFKAHWMNFLELIEKVVFEELKFHKIFTYAFDLRPQLYEVLHKSGFTEEARLKEHCLFNRKFIDVVIHSKTSNIFTKTKLYLRYAVLKDAKILYKWANEITVRNNSINQEPISWKNHLDWFDSKLNNSETMILILESEEKALGQIRIDLKNKFWVINYSIDIQFRGNGFGKEIVRLLLNKFESYKFKANVKKDNKASVNIFKSLGFRKVQSEFEDLDCFEY